jgi:hypothetical protein
MQKYYLWETKWCNDLTWPNAIKAPQIHVPTQFNPLYSMYNVTHSPTTYTYIIKKYTGILVCLWVTFCISSPMCSAMWQLFTNIAELPAWLYLKQGPMTHVPCQDHLFTFLGAGVLFGCHCTPNIMNRTHVACSTNLIMFSIGAQL